jgi:hypothetical protein
VKEIDPTTGEAEEDGYDDEYQVSPSVHCTGMCCYSSKLQGSQEGIFSLFVSRDARRQQAGTALLLSETAQYKRCFDKSSCTHKEHRLCRIVQAVFGPPWHYSMVTGADQVKRVHCKWPTLMPAAADDGVVAAVGRPGGDWC